MIIPLYTGKRGENRQRTLLGIATQKLKYM